METGTKVLGDLQANQTVFFLCDIQEKFSSIIQYFPDIVEVSGRLVRSIIFSLSVVKTIQMFWDNVAEQCNHNVH